MAEIAPGVYAITATPFDEQGRLDEDSIASLVEFELRAGVHGLNILGIMGEAHKQTEGERRRGAIRAAAVRAPGPRLDDVTRRELDGILERMGLEPRR